MGKKKSAPTNCNPQSYCTYPNNFLYSNIESNINITITDFSDEINGNYNIINSEKNVLPLTYESEKSCDYDFKTSSVGIYVNGCPSPGSTLDSFFINYKNYFKNDMTSIPYGHPNNFLGNSLPYYSWNGTGLTNSGSIIVMSNKQYQLNNTFRVIVNTVDTTTNIKIIDNEHEDYVKTENYKKTIVRTYYADFYCNELQCGYPTQFGNISTFILRLNKLNAAPTPYNFKTAIQKNSFYDFGENQSNVPTGNETAEQYLTKLINKDNDLNLQIGLDAIKW